MDADNTQQTMAPPSGNKVAMKRPQHPRPRRPHSVTSLHLSTRPRPTNIKPQHKQVERWFLQGGVARLIAFAAKFKHKGGH